MQYDMTRTTLFEVSWEVCNKVGGINAVVSTKALQAVEQFGDNYYLIGPDLASSTEFEETNERSWDLLRQVMAMRSLSCRFGRWNIPGRPKVILVNFKDRYNQNQLLYDLWNRYGVDSMTGSWDYVEPVMFSTACGEVIASIYQTLVEPVDGPAVAQFHEWMCGAGLLALKQLAPKVGTVFTTHATMLGRSMAGSGFDIYKQMRQINPNREAGAYNITAKCSMESISAREADAFTTVSDITADEAGSFLGRTPDVVTPNGLDLRVIPDYSVNREFPQAWKEKVLKASGKLLRRELPADTRIYLISGRYEFHNKGVDVFLDALAGANEALRQAGITILALCSVMGGHHGVDLDAVSGDPDKKPEQGEWWLTSHHVYNAPHDSILNACRRLGLDNRPDNPVQVIFVPALLDGLDGFLNMPYDDVLAACDLGVFPSWYEPWGYTPQESAARSVPTVTTDLSGFGLWSRDLQERRGGHSGVNVIPRRQTSYEDTVNALRRIILDYASYPDEVREAKRQAVRSLTLECSWEKFFPYYIRAYSHALDQAFERGAMHSGEQGENLTRVMQGVSSSTPSLHSFTAVSQLPLAIARLRELAYNLWWSWQPRATELFTLIDPENWERTGHNPVKVIEEASSSQLVALAHDEGYLSLYHSVLRDFDAYMAEPCPYQDPLNPLHPIAYFSTEYGIHEALPIYSGGLGVLSGDHLKSASDLNLPLIGIGLLYKNGYFRQQIDKEGRQVAVYPENDFSTLPIDRAKGTDGLPLDISLDLPGRQLHAQIWTVRVGRVTLYLMDTDTPRNTDDDRKTTERLYVADRDARIRQEILLGMGGVRLLRAMGIKPSCFHMNEGHSAFMILERIRFLMQERGLSFAAAGEVVRGSSLFTTHTPVDAGNERFALDLVERYFANYAQSIGLSWHDFLRTGRIDGSERPHYELTVLALNYALKSNGVSRLHGVVSRHMWQEGWKGLSVSEVPIDHVTNGVHVPSWLGPSMRPLLDRQLGENWIDQPEDSPIWKRVESIPDSALWAVRQHQKSLLFDRVRASLPATFQKFGIPRETQREMLSRLNPQSLVIGFARRFAPYKRATLLLADRDRLLRLLDDAERPVVILFAGKAHPADTQGVDLIQEVISLTLDPRFAGRIFFLEDYNLSLSRLLVQGCDVWLNTPRRPYEASGTSGQKVPVNGGINLSVSDGWWCEGYNGANGWTIGPVVSTSLSTEQSDYADAESLYTLLEEQVIPLYYERGNDGLPHRWLQMSRQSLQTLTAAYSSTRMVRDYTTKAYTPAAQRYRKLLADDFALPRTLAEWKFSVASRFPTLRVEELRVLGIDDDTLTCGQSMRVLATVQPGAFSKDELRVELVAGPSDGVQFTEAPDVNVLTLTTETPEGKLIYSGNFTPTRNGYHAYGVRVMPVNAGLATPLDCRMVLWG